ncbi:MAG TPA: hypothetical protein VLL52_25685 [Anaerolineae bacterium]|nr:hypothetical protein [Anaerolineae bacterium]
MTNHHTNDERPRFDDETWTQLASFLTELADPVEIHVWAEPAIGNWEEKEAINLAQLLADAFPKISYRVFPRRINYPYYPVIGVMRITDDGQQIDHGVRCIGLPQGYQITSFVAALQGVSFQGQQLEPLTRIHLHRLNQPIEIQLLTATEDEPGATMASLAYYFAAANQYIKTYVIMTNAFPEAALRYSAKLLPHVVINNRYHISDPLGEDEFLQQLSKALKN